MEKPNLLFLFSDQHRGDWLPYNNALFEEMGMAPVLVEMEHLRSMMERGTTFTNAATNSPLCVPARACLASGLQYHHSGVSNNNFCFPLREQNFYKTLKAGGYQVAGAGKFDLHKPILYWGKEGRLKQLEELGFTDAMDSEGKYDLLWSSFYESKGPYSHFLREHDLFEIHARDYIMRYFDAGSCSPTPLPDFAYADNWVTDNARSMMERLIEKQKPWFMMVNFSGPHNPWDITAAMKDQCKDKKFPLPHGYTGEEDSINQVRQNYSAMLKNIDRNIGKLIQQLKERGQYDNTIIIYSSDHGEMLGDKNRFFKSVPYRGAVQIPLIISGPGVAQNKICRSRVQLHDLAATILDFADMRFEQKTDSISLRPLAMGCTEKEIRDYQLVMLRNSAKHEGDYEGYEEYGQHQKKGPDSEYIEEFNEFFHLPVKDSVKKYDYYKDWRCFMTEHYKLVLFETGECELYDVEKDLFELRDIAGNVPETLERLKEKYRMAAGV